LIFQHQNVLKTYSLYQSSFLSTFLFLSWRTRRHLYQFPTHAACTIVHPR
jgi:hypothetical protein